MPAVASAAVSVDVTESFSGIPALRDQWNSLFAARNNEPSTSFEWTSAMTRHHVRPGDRVFLVRLEKDGALVGVVPLVLRSFAVMGQQVALLSPLSEGNSTHSDLLLQSLDDEILEGFVSAILTLNADWDCFRMARLLADNPLVPALRRVLGAHRCGHALRGGLSAYVLDLPDRYEAYLSERSAKFRNHLKRTERKLAAAGHVEIHELSDPAEFDAAYEAVLQVERASWKHSHGSAISAVAHQSAFFQELGRDALGAGRLHLQWMTLDSRPIAYNFGYLTAAGYHYLKTSYDHALRPLGPAAVLRARLIEGLIASGVRRLDFPGEPYEWESQWTDTVRGRVVLTVYPATLRGKVLGLIDRLRHRHDDVGVVHIDPRKQMRPHANKPGAGA